MALVSATASSRACAQSAPTGISAPRTVLCYPVWWLSASVVLFSIPTFLSLLYFIIPARFLPGIALTAPSSESDASASNLPSFKLSPPQQQERKNIKGFLTCSFSLFDHLSPPSCVSASPPDDVGARVSTFGAMRNCSPVSMTKSANVSDQLLCDGQCRVLQVSAATARRRAVSLGPVGDSLLGSWHQVARPEAVEESLWEAPLFISDRGMLFTKDSGFTWKVRSSVLGGSILAYVHAKQTFPNGSKWWIQHQQQQQQWEWVRDLKAECLAGANAILRHIFFGCQAALPAACFEEPTPESPGRQNWRGGRPFRALPVVCAELQIMPQQPAALQKRLLAAARTVLQRQETGEVLKDQRPQHRQQREEQECAIRSLQQIMQNSCTRVFVSDSVGLGAPGCTGTFSRFSVEDDPSPSLLPYFSLSVDARSMFLFIENGVVVCGGEAAVPVVVGVYTDSSYQRSSTIAAPPAASDQDIAQAPSGTLKRQQGKQQIQQQKQRQQQIWSLAAGQSVEFDGWWLQEGGEYVKHGMRLKCMDDAIQGVKPKVCRDLRARGFRNSLLNGVWRFEGHVNGRPHYIKYIERIDIALAAAYLDKTTANTAAGGTGRREGRRRQTPAAAAAKRVLHLYHTSKGLWLISPRLLQERLAEMTNTVDTNGSRKTPRISLLNDDGKEADASALTDTAQQSLRRVVAMARSDALEPPSGIWSVFRTGAEDERPVEATEEADITKPGTAENTQTDTDDAHTNIQTLHVEINVAKLSCLGDVF